MNLKKLSITPLGLRSIQVSHRDRLEHVAKPLSADLALNQQHNIVFDPVLQDLVTHAAPEAYAQLVYNILSTDLGSNPYWPEMGWPISRYIGAPLRPYVLPRIAQDCADALLRHPYTQAVVQAQASIVHDQMYPSIVMVELAVKPTQLPPTHITGVFAP